MVMRINVSDDADMFKEIKLFMYSIVQMMRKSQKWVYCLQNK